MFKLLNTETKSETVSFDELDKEIYKKGVINIIKFYCTQIEYGNIINQCNEDWIDISKNKKLSEEDFIR